eukprot:scaffold5017_cov75-Phaeocystis_antarctica.AAC.2
MEVLVVRFTPCLSRLLPRALYSSQLSLSRARHSGQLRRAPPRARAAQAAADPQGDVQPARRGGRAAREVGASTEETTAASCRALGRSQERQDVNRTTITSMNKPP